MSPPAARPVAVLRIQRQVQIKLRLRSLLKRLKYPFPDISLEQAKETVAKAGSDGGQQVGWAVCAVAVLSLALF